MHRLRIALVLLAGLFSGLACQRTNAAPTASRGGAETTSGSEPPRASARAFADAMLAAHNRVRAGARPAPSAPIPPLAWDDELAALAQAWADSCPNGHRPDNAYGENLYFSGGESSSPVAERAVQSWADESRSYDYGSTVCSRGGRSNWSYCGHYTQLVWRDTRRVGCGIRTDCAGTFDTVVVCNYDPPGNVDASARRIPRPY